MELTPAEICELIGSKDIEIYSLRKEISRLKKIEKEFEQLKKVRPNGVARFSILNEGEKPCTNCGDKVISSDNVAETS